MGTMIRVAMSLAAFILSIIAGLELLISGQITLEWSVSVYVALVGFVLSTYSAVHYYAKDDPLRKAVLYFRTSHLRRARTSSEALARRRLLTTVSAIILLAGAVGVHGLLTGGLNSAVALVAAGAAIIALLDLALLLLRVNNGFYGANRSEAEELLRFMASRHGKDGADPPSRAVRDPLAARQGEIAPVAAAGAEG
jgi:hypothetical protein